MVSSNARIILFVAAISLSAGCANAGDAACIWLGLPQVYRDAFMTHFQSEGQKAFVRLAAPPEVLGSVMAKCGVTTLDQNHAAIRSLIAYGWVQGAGQVMREKFHVPIAEVDAGWMALTPPQRETFELSIMDGADTGMPASTRDPRKGEDAKSVLSKVTERLHVSDASEIELIGQYLTWKVARPHYEAQF
jgi:hypothetical protein